MRERWRSLRFHMWVLFYGADLLDFAPPDGWHEERRRLYYESKGWTA